MTRKLLILGGTTEGRRLAERLVGDPGFDATLSLAGRTSLPAPQPLPVRTGGFGGARGLADYIEREGVAALVVATHPYAATIADNAARAAEMTGIPALRWLRPAWTAEPGDRWSEHPSLEALADAIGLEPRRVFVTTGRQGAQAFLRAPQHRYWFRSVDPIDPPLNLPDATVWLDRGPYDLESEIALMQRHGIEVLVTKNSGGDATRAKLEAARRLGLDVLLVARPLKPPMPHVETLDAVLAWLDHGFGPKERGE